ncbi:hypothetical protein O0L34_g9918 [Tuta absoluta]|nr:hypothetical protein O0L34_g9918 [Tuta absoluta]
MDAGSDMVNSTYWEAPVGNQLPQASESTTKSPTRRTTTIPISRSTQPGSTKKPPEIDFYDADNEKNYDLVAIIDSITDKKRHRVIPIAPVYPSHLEPEVQYGNEETDKEKQRAAFENKNKLPEETTLKPHITQKPEKPLAIYFKDAVPGHLYPETINRAETVNDFNPYEKVKIVEQTKRKPDSTKNFPENSKGYPSSTRRYPTQHKVKEGIQLLPFIPQGAFIPVNNEKFTSGHSKIFGLGIEDIEKMQSTTQSSAYNTRVSPTLPTWRDRDDTTTKNYPVNLNTEVPQCHSPNLALCRGVLPYDLAGPAPRISGNDIASFLTEMEFVVSTNCSERARLFVCSLLEPECNPPPFPPKKPCYSLCKAVMDACEGYIPHTVAPAFNCKQYETSNCMQARSPCFRREMACGDGSCIPRDWICDGNKDCPSGEDEKNCSPCEKNQYQCASGGCVQKRWVCDGYLDCPEGDDEHDETCARFGITPVTPTTESLAEPGEPGEEGAGSAPAPAVRRPNTLPGREGRQRSNSRTAVDDSSKELLITSDSSNALKRNFTRRPPNFSRLTPYKPRAPQPVSLEDFLNEDKAVKPLKQDKQKATSKTTTVKPAEPPKESTEDFAPLGLLDEFEKETEVDSKKTESSDSRKKGKLAMPPNFDKRMKSTPLRIVNNTEGKYDRVLDGSKLMRDYGLDDTRTKPLRSMEARLDEEESLREREARAGRGSPCPSGELRCVDGLCITLAQLCDGTIDCTDHADEDNCFT